MDSESKHFVVMDDEHDVEGANFLRDPSFKIYSPRVVASLIKDPNTGLEWIFDKNQKVFFITYNDTLEDDFDDSKPENPDKIIDLIRVKDFDVYDFYFKCRINKNSIPRFCFGKFNNISEAEKNSREIYSLVSGKKLPRDIPYKMKLKIHRYMIYGLVQFDLFKDRNMGERMIKTSKNEAEYVSTGKHSFQRTDAWALDTSGLFLGMLIDYYNFSSGITKMNAHLAFVNNPDYRKAIYERMEEVFTKFVHENSNIVNTIRIETEDLIRRVVEILELYIE